MNSSACGGECGSGAGDHGGGQLGPEPEPAGPVSGYHGAAAGKLLCLLPISRIWWMNRQRTGFGKATGILGYPVLFTSARQGRGF